MAPIVRAALLYEVGNAVARRSRHHAAGDVAPAERAEVGLGMIVRTPLRNKTNRITSLYIPAYRRLKYTKECWIFQS